MLAEKKMLSLEALEAQTALELPERETPVVLLITCLVCIGNVTVRLRIEDVNVAAQVCATVDAIQVLVGSANVDAFNCEIRQR